MAQDLSKLTPDQLEMYKKYMGDKTSVGTTAKTVITPDVVNVRKMEADSVITNNKPENKKEKKRENELAVFGTYLFNTQNLTFEPKLNIPTPPDYIVGTYDEILIDISGLYEANYQLKVSTDGMILIPTIGPVKVSGMTMETVTRVIKSRIAKVYMGVSTSETKVNVSLGNIRSIRISVVGEAVRPGTYMLPSLATAFNAVYACGGPNAIGTMRNIKVLRKAKVIAILDVYQFLADGLSGNNIALQDEDIIKIEPYNCRVFMNGAIKHVGIFEAKKGETLPDLIKYAGGFADNAYKEKITTYRFTEKEKTVVDVTATQMATFLLQSGDSVVVSTTINRYDNRIDIKGSVFRPGAYSLENGLTVKQLIAKSGGVKEDAYMNMASITRKKANQIPEILSFNLGNVLNGNAPDINLQKDDVVEIRSLFEFREGEFVSISGAVKEPGKFRLIENISLKDLIFKAKGFTEMASTDSIELIRVIKDRFTLFTTNKKTTVQKFSLDKELNFKDGSGDILLENGDQVIVRSISGFEGMRMVQVEGEVYQPGFYNITSKAERISDVVKRAGGFTNYAFPTGAFLLRSESTNDIEQRLNKMMQENTEKQLQNKSDKTIDANAYKGIGTNKVDKMIAIDSLNQTKIINNIFTKDGIVGLDMKELLSSPGGKYDLILEEGDIIYIPREQQTVRVSGEVLFPTMVRFDSSLRLKNYISNSGGFTTNANRSKVFVLYANGKAKSTKQFLGFRIYPRLSPGARIIVPEKPIEIKNKLSTGELIGILTSITSTTAIIYSIIKK